MKNIRLISPTAVIHDGGALGTPDEAIAAHPAHAVEIARAVLAYGHAQQQADLAARESRLAAALKQAGDLRAKYEPDPLPAYLLVVELPAPVGKADHAGILGYHRGHWLGDLLLRTGVDAFTLVEADGFRHPGATKITSLSEVSAAQAQADIAAPAP